MTKHLERSTRAGFERSGRPPSYSQKLLTMGQFRAAAVIDRDLMDPIGVNHYEVDMSCFGTGAASVRGVAELNSEPKVLERPRLKERSIPSL